MILTMWFATVSLFSHCGLRSLLQLICTLHVSHSSCCFVCCSDMLSHFTESVTYIIYCTDGNNTGPHEIRFAASPVSTAPWYSALSSIHCPPRICPLSHWLYPGQTRSCKGVCVDVIYNSVQSYYLTWGGMESNCLCYALISVCRAHGW